MIVALEDARYKLTGLREVLVELGSSIRIEELKASLPALEEQTMKENFWSDTANSSKVLQTIKQTKDKIDEYEGLCAKLEDAIALAEMAIEENDEASIPDVEKELKEIIEKED